MNLKNVLRALKVFLPSWNFFTHPYEESLQIEYTSGEQDWQKVLVAPRKLFHIIHNPTENLRLYLHSRLDKILEEGVSENSVELADLLKLLCSLDPRVSDLKIRSLRVVHKSGEKSEVLYSLKVAE